MIFLSFHFEVSTKKDFPTTFFILGISQKVYYNCHFPTFFLQDSSKKAGISLENNILFFYFSVFISSGRIKIFGNQKTFCFQKIFSIIFRFSASSSYPKKEKINFDTPCTRGSMPVVFANTPRCSRTPIPALIGTCLWM